MAIESREELMSKYAGKGLPSFRIKQINTALFDRAITSWADITTLPKDLRVLLEIQVPFASFICVALLQSNDKTTKKALLQASDGAEIETVLMKNSRGHWSICVSCQVGCAMNCSFCATGKMGLTRNLIADEIIDQYRFWNANIGKDEIITNIVFMGMGEPMANYVEVKKSLQALLKYTEIGITKIVVSTVGVLPRLNILLDDMDWPPVRLAVSLHSVDQEGRLSFMPTTTPTFLADLKTWAKAYLEKFGNRNHHLTFEYLLMKGVNDSLTDAKKLAKYVKSIGRVKVNVMAYNNTGVFDAPSADRVDEFCEILRSSDVDVTRRRSMGSDIYAACGQLAAV